MPLIICFLTEETGTGVAIMLELPSVCSEWPRFFIFILLLLDVLIEPQLVASLPATRVPGDTVCWVTGLAPVE